jgi:hypothetical protein
MYLRDARLSEKLAQVTCEGNSSEWSRGRCKVLQEAVLVCLKIPLLLSEDRKTSLRPADKAVENGTDRKSALLSMH